MNRNDERRRRSEELVQRIVLESVNYLMGTLANESQLSPELQEDLYECSYPVINRAVACDAIARTIIKKVGREEAGYVPEEGETAPDDITDKSDTACSLYLDYDIEYSENIERLAEALDNLDDDQLRKVARRLADVDLNDYGREPLEFYSVTDEGMRLLLLAGEKVVEFLGFNVWCRTTSGQDIAEDACIQRIVKETD